MICCWRKWSSWSSSKNPDQDHLHCNIANGPPARVWCKERAAFHLYHHHPLTPISSLWPYTIIIIIIITIIHQHHQKDHTPSPYWRPMPPVSWPIPSVINTNTNNIMPSSTFCNTTTNIIIISSAPSTLASSIYSWATRSHPLIYPSHLTHCHQHQHHCNTYWHNCHHQRHQEIGASLMHQHILLLSKGLVGWWGETR